MSSAPGDDLGLFGPESLSWRVHAHPATFVGGLRALLVQALHPLAMAGVSQHSKFRDDPGLRLRRTSDYVNTVTYGTRVEAEAAGALVRHVHTYVNGVDPVTHQPYSAEDIELLLWVHCAEVHSFLAAYRTYGPGLDGADQDRYLAEQVRAAELVGIPAGDVPDSRAAVRDYFASVEPRLCVSQASRDTMEFIVNPPSRPSLQPLRPGWWLLAGAAVGLMPRRLRRLYGLVWPRAVDALVYVGLKTPATAVDAVLRVVPDEFRIGRIRQRVAEEPFAAATPRLVAEHEGGDDGPSAEPVTTASGR